MSQDNKDGKQAREFWIGPEGFSVLNSRPDDEMISSYTHVVEAKWKEMAQELEPFVRHSLELIDGLDDDDRDAALAVLAEFNKLNGGSDRIPNLGGE